MHGETEIQMPSTSFWWWHSIKLISIVNHFVRFSRIVQSAQK